MDKEGGTRPVQTARLCCHVCVAMLASYRKASRLLIGMFIALALLVSTHLGEFWPFSIFPMFSQGGNPWTRSLVRELPELPSSAFLWRTVSEQDLPGTPYALASVNANQNDIANFLVKSKTWDSQRVHAMLKMFGSDTETKNLLIMQVDGRITAGDSVDIVYTPFLLITPDSTYFNPTLDYPMKLTPPFL